MENWPSYIRDLARENGYNLYLNIEPFNWNGLYKDLKKYIFEYLNDKDLKLVSKEFYILYFSKFSQKVIEEKIIQSYKKNHLKTLKYIIPLYRLENIKIQEIKIVSEDSILKNYDILCFCERINCNCPIYSYFHKDITKKEDQLYLEEICYNKKIQLNQKIIRIFLKERKDIDWIERFNLNPRDYFENYLSDISKNNLVLFVQKYFSNDDKIIISVLSRLDGDLLKKYREKIYELIENKLNFLKKFIQRYNMDEITKEIIRLINFKVDISEFEFPIRKIFMDVNLESVIFESADEFYLMYKKAIPFNFHTFLKGIEKEKIPYYLKFLMKNCSVEDLSYFLNFDFTGYFLNFDFTGYFFYDFLFELEENFPYKYLEISTELIINHLKNIKYKYERGRLDFLRLKNLVDVEKIHSVLKEEVNFYALKDIFYNSNINIKIRYLIGKALNMNFSIEFLPEIIQDNNTKELNYLFSQFKGKKDQKIMIDKLNDIFKK